MDCGVIQSNSTYVPHIVLIRIWGDIRRIEVKRKRYRSSVENTTAAAAVSEEETKEEEDKGKKDENSRGDEEGEKETREVVEVDWGGGRRRG